MQLINKLLYRSRQRGFLELDLLVGLWAEQEVPKMDIDTLQQFTVVLDQVGGFCTWHSLAVGCSVTPFLKRLSLLGHVTL
jgi:hypothetical protein